jgi:hypothetical protein
LLAVSPRAIVEKAMRGLLVLTGVAFLTGAVSQANFWLMEAFPVLGRIGQAVHRYLRRRA